MKRVEVAITVDAENVSEAVSFVLYALQEQASDYPLRAVTGREVEP